MTNVRGQSVAAIHGQSFYLESVATGTQSHTGEWLAQDMTRIIEENSLEVAGVVTDNTSANKLAWRLLGRKYPDKFFYGTSKFFVFLKTNFRMH